MRLKSSYIICILTLATELSYANDSRNTGLQADSDSSRVFENSASAQACKPLRQFTGTNGFVDIPKDTYDAVSFVREYHPWDFTEIENDLFEYRRWNGYWDFDDFYRSLHEKGILICPVLWRSPSWLNSNSLNKPLDTGDNPEDPSSYSEMADLMFQYAARYGSNPVARNKVKLGLNQTFKSGLGYIRYYEDWNEQDRTWNGREAHFTPFEYAAMSSANADGHCNTIGENMGLKNADPDARLVMGGLASISISYLDSMKIWFSENRDDKSWPIDVINVHHYSINSVFDIGRSPERDKLKAKIRSVIEWRNENAPDNEVWISEFGYDTNSESPNRVPVFGNQTMEEIQAQWLVRSFLLIASTGADRAAQFMLRDQEDENEARFRNCGLTLSGSKNYLRKPSWYYISTLNKVLSSCIFEEIVRESEGMYIYKFRNIEENNPVYALWLPTSENAVHENYCLEFDHEIESAKLTELRAGYPDGYPGSLDISDNAVYLDVSETPVFVTINEKASASRPQNMNLSVYPNPFKNEIRISKLSADLKIDYLEIINIQGKCFVHKNLVEKKDDYLKIKTAHLSPGPYLLKLGTKNSNICRLILKE